MFVCAVTDHYKGFLQIKYICVSTPKLMQKKPLYVDDHRSADCHHYPESFCLLLVW